MSQFVAPLERGGRSVYEPVNWTLLTVFGEVMEDFRIQRIL